MNNIVPIIILSGFLGSGKTTLLTKLLEHYTKSGMRPAVIMNEVGDINLDGQLVEESVPMREMLSGCICCTIRGDLGVEIQRLIEESEPDLILIEATGVANPMEILDAVTEAALLVRIEVQATITVVGSTHFLHWHRKGEGKTYRLMQDQIRSASLLLLNKSDCVSMVELQEIKQAVTDINAHAVVRTTVYCEFEPSLFKFTSGEKLVAIGTNAMRQAHEHEPHRSCNYDSHHEHHDHHAEESGHHHHHDHHHSYDHVMVYTHYFQKPIGLDRLEQIIGKLPESVYRAKGIFTSAETGERMLFQFAYRQLDLIRIRPHGNVQDVAVFIGEQFPKTELMSDLDRLIS